MRREGPMLLASAMALSMVLAGCAGRSVPEATAEPAAPLVGPVRPPADATSAPNLYAATRSSTLVPGLADVPVRVYVPNSEDRSVTVIDPVSFRVVASIPVGRVPHHITPSWDLKRLYVNNTESDSLTVIDPVSASVVGTVDVIDPYNLYFTPDGGRAIVVAERYRRLDFYDPASWALLKSVSIPWSGVNHGDFTADGRYFLASTEFSGQVVKIDTVAMEVVGRVEVGGFPVDVRVSPDGSVFYVTNQDRDGVSIVDPVAMAELAFLPTGRGAHGLAVSRDTERLYVSNRLGGTISVIDVTRRSVAATWTVGGNPDMLQVSADGRRLWVSNRFNGSVSVLDTQTGSVERVVPTGAGAHGLTLFPQPGTLSVGHNGVYR